MGLRGGLAVVAVPPAADVAADVAADADAAAVPSTEDDVAAPSCPFSSFDDLEPAVGCDDFGRP